MHRESQPKKKFPQIGTPAWGKMNRRRASLIHRQYGKGTGGPLSVEEENELQDLQKRSREELDRKYPHFDDAERSGQRVEAMLEGLNLFESVWGKKKERR